MVCPVRGGNVKRTTLAAACRTLFRRYSLRGRWALGLFAHVAGGNAGAGEPEDKSPGYLRRSPPGLRTGRLYLKTGSCKLVIDDALRERTWEMAGAVGTDDEIASPAEESVLS